MLHLPLSTERLLIRRFEASDLDAFLSFMLNPASTRYLMFEESQKTEEGAKALFEYVCNAYDSDEPVHSYAIADKTTNQYIGSCGFAPYDSGIVECYYSINAEHCGKGFATEATSAIASQLVNDYEVRAYCHPNNVAAHAVAIKSGFRSKGLSLHQNFGVEGNLFVRS